MRSFHRPSTACRRARGAALLCLLPGAATAELTLEAHAWSEVIRRGVSLTCSEPAIGATFAWDTASGWFAGAGVHYADGEPTGRSLTRGWRAFSGWFGDLGGGRAVEASVAWSDFPGVSTWDYAEVRVDYHFTREAALSVAWSPDYLGRDGRSVLIAGTWRPAFAGDRAYLIFSGGAGDLSGPRATDFFWGEAGIGMVAGRFDVALTYNAVDEDSARVFLTDRTTLALRASVLLR